MPTSILIAKVYHPRRLLGETLHRRADGFGVDLPHDLSDVLLLPAQRAVRLDLTCVEDRLEQLFVEPHLSKVRLMQCDQLLTEFLQRKILAFSRAFAGL